mmetsp:Transcript_14755/g.25124  ORF Transcript_14755/g.25124 Transcript_14755/m.25124 type:complete len:246 (-) Transcript_14755:1788-2525(-)
MNQLSHISVATHVILQINCQARRLDSFGNIDNFLQTRYSQCHILRGHTSVVECVECHLGGGFSNTLGCKHTCHFSRTNLGMMETCLNLSKHPIQGRFAQTVLLENTFTRKVASNQNAIQRCRIALCFNAQHIISNNYNKATHHGLYFFNHVFRMQVGGKALVDLELSKSILNHTLDVSWGVRVYISLPTRFTVCHYDTKFTLVFLQCINLTIEHLLYFRVMTAVFNNILPKERNFLVIVTKVWVV